MMLAHTFAVISIFSYSIGHFDKMTDGRKDAVGPRSVRFDVDFRAYEFFSFVSLTGSERSVFVRKSPYQLRV